MKNKIVVCIPTKGRPNTKTHTLFENKKFIVKHFIEPSEIDEYEVPDETKINIGENNKGITYVRNFILRWAKKKELSTIMISDDDINAFGKAVGKKTVTTDSEIWLEIYDKCKKLPFEVIGINYVQHAWHEKKAFSINSKFPEVCVMLKVDKIDWEYEDNTKEDRDFSLETIKNGYGILRFNKYWFRCPNVGTNKGGLNELYQSKKDIEWTKNIVEKWKPHAKVVNKNGRIDAKIDIKSVAKRYNKIIK